MYRFLGRPLWILSHVLVVLGVVVMIRLGFWQMNRYHDESERQHQIENGLTAEPVSVDQVVPNPAVDSKDVPESVKYRRVTVRGRWDPTAEVVVRNRSLQGSPGGWLVTPLIQADGTAVAVARGWVPLVVANAGAPFSGTEPTQGDVSVTGFVGLTQQPGPLGPKDPPTGTLDSLARVDLDRLAGQYDRPLEPVWLTMQSQDPPPAADSKLQPIEVEPPSPAQNLSYMFQWWVFALIAGAGYIVILRKVARSRAGLGGRSQVPIDDPPVPGQPTDV